nr:hypothetical protein [uncultured Oscillibacter sp.]
MPDGSGFEICKEVRKSSSVPVIFLTASDQERIYTFTPQNGVLLRNNPISAPIRKPGRGGGFNRPPGPGVCGGKLNIEIKKFF